MFSLALGFGSAAAHAQTTANGQVLSPGAPGSRTGTGCRPPTRTRPLGHNGTTDAELPGCRSGLCRSIDQHAHGDRAKAVTSLVRVDCGCAAAAGGTLPEGDTFSVVGSVTLVRLRRPALDACLATGRRISARANAATSTTCLECQGRHHWPTRSARPDRPKRPAARC